MYKNNTMFMEKYSSKHIFENKFSMYIKKLYENVVDYKKM